MKKIILSVATLLIVGISYGQNDSITISKAQFIEIYHFLDSSTEWIDKEDGNGIELDNQCKWMWRLRDELETIKYNHE